MSKELLWSDDGDCVYGWKKDFDDEQEFAAEVRSQFEDGECGVENIQVQSCISTESGLQAEKIIPLNLTDVVIENFYVAEVFTIESKE